MHIHRAALAAVVRAPDLLHQLVAREHDAGLGQKELQQFKFLEGQGDLFSVGCDGVAVQIDHKAAGLEQMLHPLRLFAAQHRLDAGHQLHHAEGLDQIVVRAEVEAVYLIILRALGRGHDYGDRAQALGRLHAAQQLYAVHTGQHYVQHDQLRKLRLLQGIPEGRPVGKTGSLEAAGLQGVHLDVTDAGIILHAPDHAHPSLCTPVTENITHSAIFTA